MGFFFAGFADEASPDICQQIKVTKQLGWSAIEVRNVGDTNFTAISDEEFEKAWAELQKNGIVIPCYGSALCNWSRPITTDFQVDVDELTTAIKRMQRTGTKIIRCMSYPNDGLTDEDWKKEVLRRLGELTKMAEDGGVILGHENCNGWAGEGPEQTLEMLDTVNSDALKLIFDTGNPVAHDQNALDFYNAVKEHVIHVHIKDGKKIDGKMEHMYCGEGDGHVSEILVDLKKSGYNGCISIEPHLGAIVHEGKGVDDAESASEKYVEYGKRIMAICEKDW